MKSGIRAISTSVWTNLAIIVLAVVPGLSKTGNAATAKPQAPRAQPAAVVA
ncbi:MAG: hypothetical protein M3463_10885 [Verrucomicrobiota bacterium]|nr:hypothetical protein [Verrucomicrobiota bacterium]